MKMSALQSPKKLPQGGIYFSGFSGDNQKGDEGSNLMSAFN